MSDIIRRSIISPPFKSNPFAFALSILRIAKAAMEGTHYLVAVRNPSGSVTYINENGNLWDLLKDVSNLKNNVDDYQLLKKLVEGEPEESEG